MEVCQSKLFLSHLWGERQDCERNIAEYEGTSPEDYPGDNSEYYNQEKFKEI